MQHGQYFNDMIIVPNYKRTAGGGYVLTNYQGSSSATTSAISASSSGPSTFDNTPRSLWLVPVRHNHPPPIDYSSRFVP